LLQTSGAQKCDAQGTYADGSLTVATRHEACDGYPIGAAVIKGLAQVCNAIDVAGDGPFWGSGTLSGHFGDSTFDGHWVFEVFDPGRSRFTIDLGVHLRSQ
jgi:hypothetical protein